MMQDHISQHIKFRHTFFDDRDYWEERNRKLCSFFIMPGGSSAGYRIARSLRFNSADSAYLNRTFAGAGDRTKWSFRAFVKRSAFGVMQEIFVANGTANDTDFLQIRFDADDKLNIAGANTVFRTSNRVFRDPTAWFDLLVAVDTSQAAASKIRAYVNGVEVTWTNTTNPTGTGNLGANAAVSHLIGASSGPANLLNAYLTDVVFVDGQQLTPDAFGSVDPVINTWVPKKYTGTYGTNGFHLDFSDNSNTTSATLGKDRSGNNNDWTPNNFSVAAGVGNDSLTDTPTNYGTDTGAGGEVRGNYCTLNSLDKTASSTLTNGNLDYTTTSAGFDTIRGTFFVDAATADHYWEVQPTAGSNFMIGIAKAEAALSGFVGNDAHGWAWAAIGNFFNNNSGTGSPGTYSTSNVIGVHLHAGTLTFYKDGVSVGNAVTGLTGYWAPALSDATVGSTASFLCNFGQRPFAHTAPAGAKALCTQNLPDPAIKNPRDYFDVNTRAGTGAAFNVSGKRFQPDLVWSKSRSAATAHAIYDSVRGVQKQLESNSTGLETTETTGLTAFNADGFSGGALAQINTSAATYVDWLWKKSALAGVDIVSFTAAASGVQSVPHNLGVTPAMVILKQISGSALNWVIWHKSLASATDSFLSFTSSTPSTSAGIFGTGHDASNLKFLVGAAMNASVNQVAYAFAEVPGFSRFGSYAGNSSTNGTFVYLGFKPRWILVKNVSQSSSWAIWDVVRNTFNPLTAELTPNATSAEDGTTTADIDVTAFGFKIRNSAAAYNGSGNTVVFAAFADVPAKYARAA